MKRQENIEKEGDFMANLSKTYQPKEFEKKIYENVGSGRIFQTKLKEERVF